jgi:tetratricopeptide (TPR) repeat protein
MDFRFENMNALWLLLLLIPVGALWLFGFRKKSRLLKSLATSTQLLGTFIRNYNPSSEWAKLILFSIGIFFLVIGLTNPVIKDEEFSDNPEGISLMMAIDVSNSMLAADISPNRLEKARSLALRLLDNIGTAKVGIIAFAGEAMLQMPPTYDLSAIKQAVQTLSVNTIPIQGTNIESVIQIGFQSLGTDMLSKKAMLIITDGEELEGNARQTASQLAQKGLIIHVAGVGTEQGIFLSESGGSAPFTDAEGSPVLSRLDAELLRDLASITGGAFKETSDLASTVDFWEQELRQLETISLPNNDLINYISLAPVLFSLALIFLLWPLVLGIMPKWWVGRKLVLSIILLLAGLGVFGQDRKAWMQEAKRLYENGEHKLSLEKYKLALLDNPEDAEAAFFTGLNHYRLEAFEDAANVFSQLWENSNDVGIKKVAAYNAGLSFAKANKLRESIEKFKQALAESPDDEDIIKNLQKALLEQKKEQPPPEKNEDDKPPMKQEDASKKLQSVMEEERRVREKMKPRAKGADNNKSW